MPGAKVSQMDPIPVLVGDELVGVVSGGANLRTTTQAIANLGEGGGPLTPEQFGAVGDGVTNDAAAIQAAIDYSYAHRKPNTLTYGNGGGRPVLISRSYNLGGTQLNINHTLRFYGYDTGSPSGSNCELIWNGTTTGIKCLAGAPGTIIEGLTLRGGFVATEGEFHAIEPDCVVTVTQCQFYDWPGDAVNEDEADHTGATNGTLINHIYTENCRCAHKSAGSDANAGEKRGIQSKANRQAGVYQTGFLGDNYYSCSMNGAAFTAWNTGAAGRPVSYCHQSGHWYAVMRGQEAWCSTHAPSGTTASNQGWIYWEDGAASPSTGVPTWFNNIVCRAGGAYIHGGLNNRSLFAGCYAEDNNPTQFDRSAVLVSPFIGARWLVSAGVYYGRADALSGDDLQMLFAAQPTPKVALGRTIVQSQSTISIADYWNTQALNGGLNVGVRFQLGLEADGITPASLAAIYAGSSSNNPATAEALIYFGTRHYTGTGAIDLRFVYDGPNTTLRPYNNADTDLGLTATRWKNGWFSGNVAAAGTILGSNTYKTLTSTFADVQNTTTTETDIFSYSVLANELGVNGNRIEAQYAGTFVSSATATRELKIKFNGTTIFDSGALTLTLAAAWDVYVTIVRVSATVIRYAISMTTEGAALTACGELTGLTLSNANILKLTGQAAGTGAATGDIVGKMSSIDKKPA